MKISHHSFSHSTKWRLKLSDVKLQSPASPFHSSVWKWAVRQRMMLLGSHLYGPKPTTPLLELAQTLTFLTSLWKSRIDQENPRCRHGGVVFKTPAPCHGHIHGNWTLPNKDDADKLKIAVQKILVLSITPLSPMDQILGFLNVLKYKCTWNLYHSMVVSYVVKVSCKYMKIQSIIPSNYAIICFSFIAETQLPMADVNTCTHPWPCTDEDMLTLNVYVLTAVIFKVVSYQTLK